MFKNKLVSIMLIVILAITLSGVIALVVVTKFTGNEKEEAAPTAEEIEKASVDIPELTTRLLSNDYIRISFKIQADGEKGKAELEKRTFQVNNIIIKELSNMKMDQFKGEAGITSMEVKLKERINVIMQDGKVVNVYTTSFLPQ